MPHTTPPYLNASDPLTRLELLCVELNLSADDMAKCRHFINEAREERMMWQNAYMDEAIKHNELEKKIALLHQQNLAPIYGPAPHTIEDFLTETDKLDFVRDKLRQFAEHNSPSTKGYYKKLAAIITTWQQLGWLRAENYYGGEDHFVQMLQDNLDKEVPINYESLKRALRRHMDIRAIEQADLRRQMLDEYDQYLAEVC